MGKKKTKNPENSGDAPPKEGQQQQPANGASSPKTPQSPTSPTEGKKGKNEPAGPPPPLRFVCRGRGLVQGFGGPEWGPVEGYDLPPCDEVDVCMSPDGTMLVAPDHKADCVNVCDAFTGQVKLSIPEGKVLNFAVSPKNTYVVTFRRHEKDDQPNLKVWEIATGQEVRSIQQNRWPALTWTSDEAYCIRQTNNGLQCLNNATWAAEKETSKLENPKVEAVAMSPGLPPYVAVFTPAHKGQPGHVKVYKAPNLVDDVVQKTMFKADSCDIYWNNPGTAVIVNCKTDSDSTGKSYYGESMVYLMLPKQKESMNIMTGKTGERVHDIAWAPNGNEFILVFGEMPQNKATLFNMKAEPLFEFGTGPKNTVAWAPNSRFIALCGFGNLAGDIQFWDRWKLDKGKMAGCKLNSCTTHAWSMDSRSFVCGVTSPRMKVDNKITVFKHNGQQLFTTPFPNELYQVCHKPEKGKLFPNRDPSPPPAGAKAAEEAAAPAVYKARGSSGLSAMLRKEREGGGSSSGSGAIKSGYQAEYIPGMPPPKPAAKKGKGGKK